MEKQESSIDLVERTIKETFFLAGLDWEKFFEKVRKKHRSEITKAHDRGYKNGFVDNGLDGANYYYDTFQDTINENT